MVSHSLSGAYSDSNSPILWEDGERVFRRGWRLDDKGQQRRVLIVVFAADHPTRSSLDRLAHEYELRDQLDGAWAARPLDLVRDSGLPMLVLEDVEGEPIDRLLGVRADEAYCQPCFSPVWDTALASHALMESAGPGAEANDRQAGVAARRALSWLAPLQILDGPAITH